MAIWYKETFSQFQRQIAVALGKQPPDKIFTGGRVLNVFTGEVLKQDIAISGDRIAYVRSGCKSPIGKETDVIDLTGKIVVPGYFDPHAHTDLFYTPWEFARAVAARGTTAIFSDSHDMANGLGMNGFVKVLKAAKSFPIRFLSGVPLASPPYMVEGDDLYPLPKVQEILKFNDQVRSGSELTPWVKVVWQDKDLLRKLFTVKSVTGRVEGHTVGAKGARLDALVSAGITSCHESISIQDVEERLRLGLYVMIRQGSIRREFGALYPFLQAYHARIMLTPDGLFADEIAKEGYMDFVLKEALKYGADPVSVIRMATLNPAVYFGLEAHLGGIAPGRLADFNVLNDIRNPTPIQVWIGGDLVGDEGTWVGPDFEVPEVASSGRPFRIPKVGIEDFRSRYPKDFRDGIPVIDVINHTVTGWYNWVPSGGMDGAAEPDHDILKIALIHRDGPAAGMGIGYVHGFRLNRDTQLASSVAHETHNIMVIGANDGEMARAVNEVAELGGGVVIRTKGKTAYRFPLPVGGIMSYLSMDELAIKLVKLRRILNESGSTLSDPLWTFVFLSFTSILRLRITVSGVYDVKKGKILYNAKEQR